MTVMTGVMPQGTFRVKDPVSALTHFIGFIAAIFATPAMLIHAASDGEDMRGLVVAAIFMMSMILLYGASSAYHSFDVNEKVNRVLRKIDHMSVFVLIAGSYTPVCALGIGGTEGTRLMITAWVIAALGMIFKACWVTCPKWVSSVMYIGMGWIIIPCIPAFIANASAGAFAWILAGGIFYTVGGVIYALKFPVFGGKYENFGVHELFHLFVLAGSICHFIAIYFYIV